MFMGKDSFSGSTFLLPFDQFHSRGTLRLEGPMGILDCKGIDYIICLYDFTKRKNSTSNGKSCHT